MRILAVIAVWVVILGGVSLYMSSRPEVTKAVAVAPKGIGGGEPFRLEVTPTFAAEADPFALEGEAGETAFVVWLNGREVLRGPEKPQAGMIVVLEPVEGLIKGVNELYVEASPPVGFGGESHGVRLRLLNSGVAVADETFWSEDGSRVTGVLRVDLAQKETEADGH